MRYPSFYADPDSGMSAYNVAVADLLNAPEIEEIDLSAYTGKKGDIIRISVTDDFKVKAVTLQGRGKNRGKFSTRQPFMLSLSK